MSFELRILSGLHRGAILPLSTGDTLTLGSDEDADIVLVDPGVKPIHAELVWAESDGNCRASDGEIYLADSPLPQQTIALSPGDMIRIGQVWIGIFLDHDKWPDLPDLPLHAPIALQQSGHALDFGSSGKPTQNTQPGADTDNPGDSESSKHLPRKKKLTRLIVIPGIIIVMASAVVAFAYTMRPIKPTPALPHVATKLSPTPDSKQNSTVNKISPVISAPAGAAPAIETLEELQSAFKAKLRDAELINRFDFDLKPDAWNMRADLDDEEGARFERLLKAFIAQHKITFPVNAKIVTAEGLLPFRIRQVTYGVNASIITNKGERLYVGDELDGVRLIAVDNHKLTFAGKRKIEVIW